MQNQLRVQNLCYQIGKREILKNFSFNCTNGIIALLGNNGVGKSTLMNILAGILYPHSGEVYLNEESLLSHRSYPIEKAGYLPQMFDMYHNVTGYDFLSYVYDVKKLPPQDKKQHLQQIVEDFSLQEVIRKKIGKYSGGYKRRLGIAQAVIGHPDLILVDEPTVGLDPEQRIAFRELLSRISLHSITIISTHIIEDVELYSDKLMIIGNDHTLQFDGTVNELIDLAKPHLLMAVIDKRELNEVRNKVHIIEEKRMADHLIQIKYISRNKTATVLDNSCQVREVSLENAYIYFQHAQNL
ncbi:ATP-binding cassette domain-containing protein [Sporosarcina sp. HYO08]|uniref:ATP-binding cassette domain-containing protein n=1 Tax=Sporosarcina sp. HYO08 TaxID=1759557 RepID=UPI0007990D55|nr:ATP-binding cassette domain-containing protein [Sporosarcina sp. HYO08]KXH78359.1 ABC transporter ATP-binding protein [Sporosarcina sp. HYO08]